MEPSKLVLVSAEANQVLVAESNSKCSCWSQPHFHLDYYSSQPQHKTLILTIWFQLEQWSHLCSWNVPNHWIWFSPWIQTKLIWIWCWIDTFNIFIHPSWCYVQGCGAVCLPGASCSVTKNNGMKRRVCPLLLSILVRGHWSSPRHGAELSCIEVSLKRLLSYWQKNCPELSHALF